MAAGSTYTPIATTTLGSATASYTFSSISSTYTDLVLVCSWSKSAAARMNLYFNGDTGGTTYSYTRLVGDGSSATSDRLANFGIIDAGYTDTTIATSIIHLNNYSNTTTYKTVLIRVNATINAVAANVALWRNTAAINSITLGGANNLQAGSTFTLYGIAAA
jgi:hypothetical protein